MTTALDLTTSSLRRTTTTTTLNANHCDSFVMNDVVSDRYETTPIHSANSRVPGYAGHIPGKQDCFAQRKAQATLHTSTLRPLLLSSRGRWQDMQLVDLRAQERSYNKNYLYAENSKSTFMVFPTAKTLDHRRI